MKSLHENGIAHLDIKTENILFKGNNIKFADFGMSEFFNSETEISNDFTKGTPFYRLIDIEERKPYSVVQADIYSLAVVLFAIYACLIPF